MMAQPASLQAAPVENVPPVVKAAKAINTFLQMDEGFPGLDTYCGRKATSFFLSLRLLIFYRRRIC
jgi:nuclear pore complex protein Nup155